MVLLYMDMHDPGYKSGISHFVNTPYCQMPAKTGFVTAHTAPSVHRPSCIACDLAYRAKMLICLDNYRNPFFFDVYTCARRETCLPHKRCPLGTMRLCSSSKTDIYNYMCQLMTEHLVQQFDV